VNGGIEEGSSCVRVTAGGRSRMRHGGTSRLVAFRRGD